MIVVYSFVNVLAAVLNIAILARVLLSWIPVNHESRLVLLIVEITEPILGPIRRILPPLGGLDLSPFVALILIQVAQNVLLRLLRVA
jgi:YggT family protein